MTFRASSTVPSTQYNHAKALAWDLKNFCIRAITETSGRDTTYPDLHSIYRKLRTSNDNFDTAKTVPNIGQYARDQEDDQAYDVATQFATMQAAMDDCLSWLDGAIGLSVTLDPPEEWEGTITTSDTYTVAQTALLRTKLQAVADTIS